jgi:hypothetical protein
MRSRTGQWTALAMSAVVALAGGLWVLNRVRGHSVETTVDFREMNESAADAFPYLSSAEFFRLDEPVAIPSDPAERRFYLPREALESAFGRDDRVAYDPWSYVRDAGGRDEVFPWPEHPRGECRLTTNRYGLRERGDPLASRRDVRILLTGDSHAFGVCDEDETAAARLEVALAEALAPRSVEVLNAAQPGYDTFNYLGVLYGFLAFEPQVFAILYFGGNDLASGLELYYRFTRASAPPRQPDEKRRRAEMLGHAPNALGQCYGGGAEFLAHPEHAELAVRIQARLFAEMRAVCAARGIRLLVVYLPSPCDLAWRDPPEEIELGRRLAGLPPGTGSGLEAAEREFLAALGALSIEVIDMRERFAARADPPYWRRDLHLDVSGHALAADALAERIVPMLARK